MHWFCETPSLQQIDPAWPALPDTAMALLPKRRTGSELLGAEQVLAQQMGDSRLADFAAGHAPASISATDEFVLLHSAGQHDGLLAGAGLETCTPVQYGLDHATLVRTTDAVLRI